MTSATANASNGLWARLRAWVAAKPRDERRLAARSLLAQVVTFAATPAVAAAYGRDRFGAFVVFQALAATLGAFAPLQYEQAMLVAADDSEAVALRRVAATTAMIVAALVAAAIAPFAPRLVAAEDAVALRWSLLPALLAIAAAQIAAADAVRRRRFAALGVARLAQATLMPAVAIALLRAAPAWGLPTGAVVGAAASAIICAVAGGGGGDAGARAAPRVEAWAAARRARRFPLWSSWQVLVDALRENAIPLVLTAAYGQSVTGEYGLARRIVGAPAQVLAGALAPIAQRRLLDARGGGGRRVARRLVALALAALIPATLLLVGLVWVAVRVAAPRWASVPALAAAVAPWSVAAAVSSLLSIVPQAMGRQQTFLLLGIAYGAVVIAAIAASAAAGLGAAAAVAATSAGATVVLAGVVVWTARLAGEDER